jgi:putative transposase
MSHTCPNVLIHCVFSTKNRRDSIPDELLEKTRMHFVGIGKGHDIPVISAGGTANHAHLLIALPATMALAIAVQVLKANSSRWLAEHSLDFAWQEGYGAFSVSTSNVNAVKHYIEHQAEHHAKHSFEDEFVALLAKTQRGLRFTIRLRMRKCRPYGTRLLTRTQPGTAVTGFPMSPLRGWSILAGTRRHFLRPGFISLLRQPARTNLRTLSHSAFPLR